MLSEHDGATIVSEEGTDDRQRTVPETGRAWVVDPIDGTANYVRGIGLWATSVAATEDGQAVAAANVIPELETTVTAGRDGLRLNGDPAGVSDRTETGTFAVAVAGRSLPGGKLCQAVIDGFGGLRRLGSVQATLSFVATGGIDAAVTAAEPTPWDAMAGALLVERGGGQVTTLAGEAWRPGNGRMVASNGAAHDAVRTAVRDRL